MAFSRLAQRQNANLKVLRTQRIISGDTPLDSFNETQKTLLQVQVTEQAALQKEIDRQLARLTALAGEVADLEAKLPPELRAGEDAFAPAQSAYLRRCLEDVQALLLDRLLGRAMIGPAVVSDRLPAYPRPSRPAKRATLAMSALSRSRRLTASASAPQVST